jgi:putative transposase
MTGASHLSSEGEGSGLAARKVVFHEGGYYHVYNRSANKQDIFLRSSNYHYLIGVIKRFVSKGIQVIACCLMPNHYHFLLRQEAEYSVSQLIQSVFNIYSKAFNRMYDRSGTLFGSPFHAIEVLHEGYLIHLCRYIHRNPLEADLVDDIRHWPYSNYLEWINKRNNRLVDRNFIDANFSNPTEYEKFVLDYQSPNKIEMDFQKYLIE